MDEKEIDELEEDDVLERVKEMIKSLENLVEALNNRDFDKIKTEKKTDDEKP